MKVESKWQSRSNEAEMTARSRLISGTSQRSTTLILWILVFELLIAVVQLIRTLMDPSTDSQHFIHADTLFPAAMYQDLFVDHYPIQGWQFPTAPFWFPDCLLYFICRALFSSHSLALVSYALLQFGLLVASFIFLLRTIIPEFGRFLTITITSSAILHLTALSHHQLDSQILVCAMRVQNHTGVAICMIMTLGLAIQFLHPMTTNVGLIRIALSLFLMNSLIIASDRLYIIQLSLPLVTVICWGWIKYRKASETLFSSRRVASLLIFLGSSVIVGTAIHKWLTINDSISTYLSDGSASRKTAAFIFYGIQDDLIHGRFTTWFVTIWVLMSCVWLGSSFIRRSRHASNLEDLGPLSNQATRTMIHFSLLLVVCNILAFIVTGALFAYPDANPDWKVTSKYFLPIYWIPFYIWGIWFTRNRLIVPISVIVLIVTTVFISISLSQPRSPQRDFIDFYPPIVQEIDQLAEKYNLHDGVGGYWESRLITLFSKRGVRVHPIQPRLINSNVIPYHWVTNIKWFSIQADARYPFPKYDFVILKAPNFESDRSEWDQYFGEPAITTACQDLTISIYNRDSDHRFRNMFRDNLTAIIAYHQHYQSEGITFPAKTLPSSFPNSLDPTSLTLDRTAVEGIHPEGFLTFGPYLRVHGHRYRVIVKTSSTASSDSNGFLNVALNKPGANPGVSQDFPEIAVPPGMNQVTESVVTIPTECQDWLLECRLRFTGKGRLTLHELQVLPLD
jgi:hypothetical protein